MSPNDLGLLMGLLNQFDLRRSLLLSKVHWQKNSRDLKKEQFLKELKSSKKRETGIKIKLLETSSWPKLEGHRKKSEKRNETGQAGTGFELYRDLGFWLRLGSGY